jgi:hypothetical protein
MSFAGKILSVYVWLYGYMVAKKNLKEGKKRIIIERTQRGGNRISVTFLK